VHFLFYVAFFELFFCQPRPPLEGGQLPFCFHRNAHARDDFFLGAASTTSFFEFFPPFLPKRIRSGQESGSISFRFHLGPPPLFCILFTEPGVPFDRQPDLALGKRSFLRQFSPPTPPPFHPYCMGAAGFLPRPLLTAGIAFDLSFRPFFFPCRMAHFRDSVLSHCYSTLV